MPRATVLQAGPGALALLVLTMVSLGCAAPKPARGVERPVLDAGVSICPAGTCRRSANGPCEAPTGQLGNACCGCGSDGFCSSPCRCLSPHTLIATPEGEREVESLEVDDKVVSLVGRTPMVVRITALSRCPVSGHSMLRLRLSNGRVLEGSAGHPLADGRPLSAVSAGDELGGVHVLSVERVVFEGDFTLDLLPDSDSAAYLAEGVWLRSTMAASHLDGGAVPFSGCAR